MTVDANFECKLKKHFSKKPKVAVVTQSRVVQRQIENVFDYQRAIIIQTSMLRNQIDLSLLDQIDEGNMEAVSPEQLSCLLSIYPREAEIKLLVSKL